MQRLKNAIKPAANWGPSNPRIFREWRKVVDREFGFPLRENFKITESIPETSTIHNTSENIELGVKNVKRVTFHESEINKHDTSPPNLFKTGILKTTAKGIQKIT